MNRTPTEKIEIALQDKEARQAVLDVNLAWIRELRDLLPNAGDQAQEVNRRIALLQKVISADRRQIDHYDIVIKANEEGSR